MLTLIMMTVVHDDDHDHDEDDDNDDDVRLQPCVNSRIVNRVAV